jgi:hypothetical protein
MEQPLKIFYYIKHTFYVIRTAGLKELFRRVYLKFIQQWKYLRARFWRFNQKELSGKMVSISDIEMAPPILIPHSASVDIVICVHNALEDVRKFNGLPVLSYD